jgi:hypothetical protein
MTVTTIILLSIVVGLCCYQIWRHPDDKPYLALAMGVALFAVIIPAFQAGSILTGLVGALFSALGGFKNFSMDQLTVLKLWRQ